MEVFEITTQQTAGFQTGVSNAGVNYLQPTDAFQNMINGFIYRGVLQSRLGFTRFCPRLADESRIFGIFEHITPSGTSKSIAIDANFLYVYNSGTGIYDQIAFGGSLIGFPGFALNQNYYYVSGASYPDKNNNGRFVFTGQGMTKIYFYDDTSNTVKDYTSLVDNPDYQAPVGGALTTAYFVLWFNGRINFIRPTIGGIQFNQMTLYSAIKNASGNGDKFASAGAGNLEADTYEDCTGAIINGNFIVLNFTRSNWTLEKTADPFNPYFIKRVPGVVGTDANFSAVAWGDMVKSLGQTGVVGTNGRESLRVDNKIPNFTTDEISQNYFGTSYGGFDRINNQFLWSYVKEASIIGGSDVTTQNSTLVNNYEFDTWATFDWRFSCFGQTKLGRDLVWNDIYEVNNPTWGRWDTTEETWNTIGLGATVQKTLAGDDLGYIYQINTDLDDYSTSIIGISNASQAVVQVTDEGFQVGDEIVIENVQGMTEINNYDPSAEQPLFPIYTVESVTGDLVTINADSTDYGIATPNTGTISKIIEFSAETIPFNPWRSQGVRVFISHVEFYIERNGGFMYVDVFENEETAAIIPNVLIKPNSTEQKGSEWVSMSVNNEANFMTFRLRQKSPSAQMRLTSMRIHCQPGGYTSN